MIIGIDGNEANVEKKVGVSVYTQKLLEHFALWANEKNQFIVYLKNNPLKTLPQENNFFKYKIIKGKFLWSQVTLPLELYFGKKIDVFFSPAHYAPRFCKSKIVTTIHDLSYFYYPEEFLKRDLYKLKNWTKYSVKNSSKIICVSENTKKDLINFYDIKKEKIAVIHNGFEKNTKDEFKNYLYEKPYILYVGTIQPRKNIETLIDAFYEILKKFPNYKLVIAGKKGWLYSQIFKKAEVLEINKNIIFTDYVSDDELIYLYKNADFFVMPSFYEGFGIPILEAMSFNCPVIAANNSSLPEIGENACLYFDPNSKKELVDKINLLINNKDKKNTLIKLGQERVKLFSWEKCAKKTLEVLINT